MNSKTVRCSLAFVFKRFKGEVFNAFFKVIPTFYSYQVNVEFTIVCLACVAANSFPFSGGAEIEQANEKRRAKEHAWGEPKIWGEAYFGTLSQFSYRSRAFGKGKETAATQAIVCFDGIDVIG